MTTKRKKSKAISRSGVNYVRHVVEQCNCIFHEIDLDNDLGTDAYLEFVDKEEATGCIIAAQIKPGQSYYRDAPRNALIQSDTDHFEYWKSHSLPIAMIVYNPENGSAAWCDVTAFLMAHPERIENGPYTIEVPLSCHFDEKHFTIFYHHLSNYRGIYKQESFLGRALRDFADIGNAEVCFDGLFSLFSFHRNRFVSWYYISSCFRNFRNHPALVELIVALCHLAGHQDIFWHRGNLIDWSIREQARTLLAKQFGRDEVLMLLGEIDEENGISRGSIGQCVHSIIHALDERGGILESIVFDVSVPEHSRYWALVLSAYYKQDNEHMARALLAEYLTVFPGGGYRDSIEELIDVIQEHGSFALY